MQQIGYSLIDTQGQELSSWGNDLSSCAAVPRELTLSNGNPVGAPSVGETFNDGSKLVGRFGTYGSAYSIAYDGTRIVVTWPITVAMVVAERERRLALGFDYNFNDARGIHHIQTTAEDMVGWDEVTKLSNALIATGQGSTTINILTGTGPTHVTAIEWQSVLVAAGQFRQPIWAKSFALEAMNPIPADYTVDTYWI